MGSPSCRFCSERESRTEWSGDIRDCGQLVIEPSMPPAQAYCYNISTDISATNSGCQANFDFEILGPRSALRLKSEPQISHKFLQLFILSLFTLYVNSSGCGVQCDVPSIDSAQVKLCYHLWTDHNHPLMSRTALRGYCQFSDRRVRGLQKG